MYGRKEQILYIQIQFMSKKSNISIYIKNTTLKVFVNCINYMHVIEDKHYYIDT